MRQHVAIGYFSFKKKFPETIWRLDGCDGYFLTYLFLPEMRAPNGRRGVQCPHLSAAGLPVAEQAGIVAAEKVLGDRVVRPTTRKVPFQKCGLQTATTQIPASQGSPVVCKSLVVVLLQLSPFHRTLIGCFPCSRTPHVVLPRQMQQWYY